jgi:hypothetical protein
MLVSEIAAQSITRIFSNATVNAQRVGTTRRLALSVEKRRRLTEFKFQVYAPQALIGDSKVRL